MIVKYLPDGKDREQRPCVELPNGRVLPLGLAMKILLTKMQALREALEDEKS